MKNFITLFFLLSVFSSAVAQEEFEEPRELKPRNVVRYNFFGVFNKSFTVEYERVINKKFSAQVAVGYRSSNLDWQVVLSEPLADPQLFDLTQKGYTVVPEFKFYWTHFSRSLLNPTGAYFAPFLRIGYYNIEFKDYIYNYYDETFDLLEFGGGTVFGFQILAGRAFAVDIFAGPQVKYSKISNEVYASGVPPANTNPNGEPAPTSAFNVGLRAGLSVGFGF